MKILLSAYACEPNKGSEPAVGWNWAIALAKLGHCVTVITKSNNRESIENYFRVNDLPWSNRLKFVYFESSRLSYNIKKLTKSVQLFYIFWQYEMSKSISRLVDLSDYDIFHHCTFVSAALPVFISEIDLPTIMGPVGGGEEIHKEIAYPLSSKNKIKSHIRKIAKYTFGFVFNYRKSFKNYNVILSTTNETKLFVELYTDKKVELFQAIGVNEVSCQESKCSKETLRIAMIGRQIYWKAYDIGLKAIKSLLDKGLDVELILLGNGPERKKLEQLAGDYLHNQIKFTDGIPYDQMNIFYESLDIMLNTSLHDSGSMVVLEAMSHGIPTVVLDVGGPKVLTTSQTSIKIKPIVYNQIVDNISNEIELLYYNRNRLKDLSRGSIEHVKQVHLFERKARIMENYYKYAINESKTENG